ncbi:MAG: hypothetical protein P1S60_18900, partial [Anaerolineae bacterium]|nr:hypothetical protein [Anaerolineae bacterium]
MPENILIREQKWAPRIDHLWMMIILASILFFASLVPLLPNDFWWHLKVGEIIVTTRSVPATNMFGWTLAQDQPFIYGAWFGEVLLYLLYRAGGMGLVTFARTALLGLTWAAIGLEAKRRSGSWRLAAISVLLGFAMMSSNVTVRPQIWSWLPFAAYFFLLNGYTANQLNRNWLFLCPALMLFWVNAHGAFVLGAVLLGIFITAEALRQIFTKVSSRSWQKVRWLAIIIFLTLLAMLVNPQGPGIFGYVANLMTDQPSQKYIMEWQSPTPEGVANTVFFLSVLIFVVLCWYLCHSPKLEDVILFSGFLWLAWSGVRYVIWFAFVATPMLAELGLLLLGDKSTLATRVGRRNVINVIITILVFVPVLLVQPWLVEGIQLPLPETYWDLVHSNTTHGPFVSVNTPIDAADYLRINPGKKMFNEMGYGSYFIWALPDTGVFIDPRVELYPL